ncbi:unnamed protein product [Rangifer tarandus platyrhynchus]|uniref:Uncharacterized protein n=1 Tax=Rangifer tarandus platyrhynchus TaxID=3082113 RepID=A0ABN8Y8L3_RANTA|nr:unnamed protein product [Rangifer tarandus platyrhynchus]
MPNLEFLLLAPGSSRCGEFQSRLEVGGAPGAGLGEGQDSSQAGAPPGAPIQGISMGLRSAGGLVLRSFLPCGSCLRSEVSGGPNGRSSWLWHCSVSLGKKDPPVQLPHPPPKFSLLDISLASSRW